MNNIKILLLAADPSDSSRLRLGQECRDVESALRDAASADAFTVRSIWAVRTADVQQSLLRELPHIVHFSGHGDPTGRLVFETESGTSQAVPNDALVSVFRTLADNIRIVLLNACFSEDQALAITSVIDFAIGMSREIDDGAAIRFASGFYFGLAHGRSVQEAFDVGVNELKLIGTPDASVPRLFVKEGLPAEAVSVPF